MPPVTGSIARQNAGLEAPDLQAQHAPVPTAKLTRVLVALTLFAVAFGYVEAAVVAYLRTTYEPLHSRLYPDRAAGDLFPLITLEQLASQGAEHVRRLKTELAREAATLVMLAAAALAVATNVRTWFAAFMLVFGVWDIVFYACLKVLLDWPSSLLAWDILFLLPVPWVGPVLAPVLVSLSMIAAGAVLLVREAGGRPVRIRPAHWLAIHAGGLVIVVAFCWDFANTMAGGYPSVFNWPLFIAGLSIGLTAFMHACLLPRAPACQPA